MNKCTFCVCWIIGEGLIGFEISLKNNYFCHSRVMEGFFRCSGDSTRPATASNTMETTLCRTIGHWYISWRQDSPQAPPFT